MTRISGRHRAKTSLRTTWREIGAYLGHLPRTARALRTLGGE